MQSETRSHSNERGSRHERATSIELLSRAFVEGIESRKQFVTKLDNQQESTNVFGSFRVTVFFPSQPCRILNEVGRSRTLKEITQKPQK